MSTGDLLGGDALDVPGVQKTARDDEENDVVLLTLNKPARVRLVSAGRKMPLNAFSSGRIKLRLGLS